MPSSEIKRLKVGNKIYSEDRVADGFYDSISKLKSLDKVSSSSFDSFVSDYKHIVEIMKTARKIPRISPQKASELLLSKNCPNQFHV